MLKQTKQTILNKNKHNVTKRTGQINEGDLPSLGNVQVLVLWFWLCLGVDGDRQDAVRATRKLVQPVGARLPVAETWGNEYSRRERRFDDIGDVGLYGLTRGIALDV